MKSTGIVRRVNDIGMVVLPSELRRTLEINEGDPLEIYTEGENIILRKHNSGCYCCKEVHEEYKSIFGRNICDKCYEEFKKQMNLIDSLRGVGFDSRR